MKRKMMLCERIMYVDRETPFTLVQAARIRGRLDPEQLRHALDRIQLKHPMLRCAVLDGDSPQIVLEDDPAPIPLRLVARESDQDWLRESHIERETAFASDRAPLMRAVWIHDEDGGELLLTCHHCICDVRPSCMRAPPLAVKQTNAVFCSIAEATPRTKRSPTTEPIEPPMKRNSNAATTTGTVLIAPCITSRASVSPVSVASASRRSV